MKILFLLTMFAQAEAPVNPNFVVCDIIRSYVAVYGEAAAIKWAKDHKWSKMKIAEAKACLVR